MNNLFSYDPTRLLTVAIFSIGTFIAAPTPSFGETYTGLIPTTPQTHEAPPRQINFCNEIHQRQDLMHETLNKINVAQDLTTKEALSDVLLGQKQVKSLHTAMSKVLGKGQLTRWVGTIIKIDATKGGPIVEIDVCRGGRAGTPAITLVMNSQEDRSRIHRWSVVHALDNQLKVNTPVVFSADLILRTWGLACADGERFCRVYDGIAGFATQQAARKTTKQLLENVSLKAIIREISPKEHAIGGAFERILASAMKNVQLSSALLSSMSAEALLDGNIKTFWHVNSSLWHPNDAFWRPNDAPDIKGNPVDWVLFDFGDDTRRTLNAMRFRPRIERSLEFLKTVQIDASNDQKEWMRIATTSLQAPSLNGAFTAWRFSNKMAYRYYKVSMPTGFMENRFLSLADLELYAGDEPRSTIRYNDPPLSHPTSLPPDMKRVFPVSVGDAQRITASSYMTKDSGIEKLVDGNVKSAWHVTKGAAKTSDTSWLVVDLGAHVQSPIQVLRAQPAWQDMPGFFRNAYLQGSHDLMHWSDLVQLQSPKSLDKPDALSWHFDNTVVYRYLRLTLPDGMNEGGFQAMSELELFSSATHGSDAQDSAYSVATLSYGSEKNLVTIYPPKGQSATRIWGNTVLNPSMSPKMVIDGDLGTSWHVDVDPKKAYETPTLVMDLGDNIGLPLQSIHIWPRADAVVQFFKTAYVEGSTDNQNWQLVTTLKFPIPPLDGSRISWDFANDKVFRYYKMSMFDGYAGSKFMSFAEIKLLGRASLP